MKTDEEMALAPRCARCGDILRACFVVENDVLCEECYDKIPRISAPDLSPKASRTAR